MSKNNIMDLKKYSKETKKYIQSIIDYISKKYGEVPAEWEAIIYLLADNLDLYNECKDSVKDNGIYNSNSGRKNPLLTTMKDLQATIMKQVQNHSPI